MDNYEFKTQRVGLIGGMSHETSDHYVQEIHRRVQTCLCGNHSAQLVHLDVDFDHICTCMRENDWTEITAEMRKLISELLQLNVKAIAIASNTIHKVVPEIVDKAPRDGIYRVHGVPLIHIGDSVIRELPHGAKRILLLGTKYTMSEDFMTAHYRRAGYEVSVPDKKSQSQLNNIIFDELCRVGSACDGSQRWFRELVFHSVSQNDIDAVVLGCTELQMLVDDDFSRYLGVRLGTLSLPVVDSAAAHIRHIAEICVLPKFR